MGVMVVTTQVRFRNNIGQFQALMGAAGVRAAEELTEKAAELAGEIAPVGPARDDYARRPKLSSSIEPVMVAPKSGVIGSRAGHAGPQETGARGHWIPNAFGSGRPVWHPGNAPQPFLRPALVALKAYAVGILKRAYPG